MKLRTLEISIPHLPATYNSIGRKHWTAKLKESRRWITLVKYYVSETKFGFVPMKKANITFTRFATRLLDPDNVPQTFKHVMDGLVKSFVLEDDGPNNIIGLSYKQEKCKRGEQHVRVKVEEV